jgi:hypothetical protein
MGQTLTHLPQRMQGCTALRRASPSVSTVMELVPLHTGTSRLKTDLPIIGPPASTLLSPSGMPPQASMSCPNGVPMRTRKLRDG